MNLTCPFTNFLKVNVNNATFILLLGEHCTFTQISPALIC